MFTKKMGDSNIDFYEWEPVERFVPEFEFIITAHQQIIDMGVKNIADLNEALHKEIADLQKDLEKKRPGDEEYIDHVLSDHGSYQSMIINNYAEVLWKSTIVYQVNEIESHLKSLVPECAEFFKPGTKAPNSNRKIISTYHDYIINVCGIKSSTLDTLGPKMINYYKVRNCITHDNGVPDSEVKEIIRQYKNIPMSQKETYKPSIDVLLSKEYCSLMLNDIETYFKELYIQVDNAYSVLEKARRKAQDQSQNEQK